MKKNILILLILVQCVPVLYGMSGALGTHDLKQVATFWISSVMPKAKNPYATRLGQQIVAGKYKEWGLTQTTLEAEVDSQLNELTKITKLASAGGVAGPEFKPIADIANDKSADSGIKALASLITGYDVKGDTAGKKVLQALKGGTAAPADAKLKVLYDKIIVAVKEAIK